MVLIDSLINPSLDEDAHFCLVPLSAGVGAVNRPLRNGWPCQQHSLWLRPGTHTRIIYIFTSYVHIFINVHICTHTHTHTHTQIKEIRTVARAKEDALRQADRGTWEALKWLRENRDRFEKDVLGPVCLELSVKDRDSARLIETALAKKKLLGFIVQSDKDYDTFMKEATKHGSTLKACTCSRMLQSDTNQEFKEDLRAARGKLDEYGIDGTLKSR